ncbi:MAG: cytochrome c3 family protein [Bacteroidia bacterium]
MLKGGKKKLFLVLVAIFALSVFIIRCTPEKHFRTLSFFFDGVPDPNKKPDSLLLATNDTSHLQVKKAEQESFDHKPYAEDKCESCHEKGFSNRLLIPQPDLCYTCHRDFRQMYASLHGPVASGNCTACHNQHTGKYKYLLMQKGQDICLYCHQKNQVFANKLHKDVGDKNCTECHSPHGGSNRGMLTGNSCFTCHENFSSKFNFLHGPVASGNCLSCHSSHSDKSAKHLQREGQDICLYCHNEQQVFARDVHKKAKKKNCTECHNPHGGGNHYILVSSMMPAKSSKATGDEIKSEPLQQDTSLLQAPEVVPVNSDTLRTDSIPAEPKQQR